MGSILVLRAARRILIAWRHGLRGQELADIEWRQVEFNARDAVLHVKRILSGRPFRRRQ
jgi:hypothetical protein